jgi:hypothetical protein
MRPEFEGFGKIPRLNRDIVVTEKIDGTNAGIWISEDTYFMSACSRKRWITPEDDNYGFAKWVRENGEELRQLGPGLHWGEWWGAGIQRRYGLDHKRFSLFNTGRWLGHTVEAAEEATPPPACCHVVPVLWIGNFKDFNCNMELAKLAGSGSMASRGFMKPEGIMIWHEAARSYFKATIMNDAKPKGSME